MDARALEAIQARLAEAERNYCARHPASAERHAEAARHLPGGNTRTVLHYPPFPLTWASGRDNRLVDLDGHEFVDLLGEFSAGLYGHSEPVIQAAMKQAIDDGLVLGGPNRYEARLAAAIKERFPSIELIRFTNSGTEANLIAFSLARALSGRPRILVFDGAYHGGVFDFGPAKSRLGLPVEWLIGEFNDIETTCELIDSNSASLAAVVVEPVMGRGCLPASNGFLGALREASASAGAILIFDEVMTSRLSPSGMQGVANVRPDLTTFGKYLGGGASFGALGGRRDLMQRFDPSSPDGFAHAGTFNNNVLSMAAGWAGLTKVFTPQACARVNTLGDRLRAALNAAATARQGPLRATGFGSLVGLHFTTRGAPTRPREAYSPDPQSEQAQTAVKALFHLEMLARGYFFSRRGYIALPLPTTAADCDGFVAAVDDFLARNGRDIAALLPC
jgi:glutamate-1-semialdehyde 2,1-aminomutase